MSAQQHDNHAPSDSAGAPDVGTLEATVRAGFYSQKLKGSACKVCGALNAERPERHSVTCPVPGALAALSDLAATARYAEREVEAQMQAKLDAQSLLANIVEALGLSRSDFDLSDTWRTVGPMIIKRLTEIVECAEAAVADRGRLARRVAELEAALGWFGRGC